MITQLNTDRTLNSKAPAAQPSPVLEYLQQLHTEFAPVKDGKVATYIPELAKANPDWFGISLVTTNGTSYEVGDSRQQFTIQSISKPFVYGLALEDHGRPHVISKVGMEPTGDAFNSISLEPGTGRPRNPMINAGAIATSSLVVGKTAQGRLRRVVEMMSRYAGRDLSLDNEVYRSESETGHRNRAIGHMLRNFDILTTDPIPSVELYFKQCSVSVTAHDLAVMAATLANRGVNPITKQQAIRGEYVESVLSVMGSCGMYDYAGEWIYTIGMPAKSGVAGGIIAVLPGQLGVAVFSPPLDARGNSVRGIKVCDALSRHCDLHILNRPNPGETAIRLKCTGAELSSNRIRTPEESQVLHQGGSRIHLYQLQGNLHFATAETIVHDVMSNLDGIQHLILDFKKVLTVNESACRLLHEVLLKFAALDRIILFTHADHLPLLRRYMKVKLGTRYSELFRSVPENDLALEWSENRIIESSLPTRKDDRPVTRGHYELFKNFSANDLIAIAPLLQRRTYQQGETIINAGDDADELYFLARGGVSVFVPLEGGGRKRLATFTRGMVFGEMAVIDRAPRSAMIVADTEVTCDVLSTANFDGLGTTHPELKIKLLENLCLVLCRRLRMVNRKLSVFD